MVTGDDFGRPARALEITMTLAGRRIGLCGFDTAEEQNLCGIFHGVRLLPVPFDESLLAESARVCDALLVKLLALSAPGLRAAASSTTPVLVTTRSEALLEGSACAYGWPKDFIIEPWCDAELIVRLFRLLETPSVPRACGPGESRKEPLVLIADDDPEMAALVDVTLWNDGIRCLTADNGLKALRMAREFLPDLILLDIKMPGMNGFEVLETIRRNPALEAIPVIVLTGCNDPNDVVRGSELNADEYLAKPVSPNLLLNRVKRLLAGRGARKWARSFPGNNAGEKMLRRWVLAGSPQPGMVKP